MKHVDIQKNVLRAMHEGGFYDGLMAAGDELDRVKHFLRILDGKRDPEPGLPYQNPWMWPIFPGLRSQPVHERVEGIGTEVLEEHFEVIRDEVLRLGNDLYVPYTTKTTGEEGDWSVFPLTYMGVKVDPLLGFCPETWRVVTSLPRTCYRYPWGDVLFSRHKPGTHLPAHCSVDNLRLRCHLPITVPAGPEIRVANGKYAWTEGKCFLFEDSFEHEVWHHGDTNRLILILDFWHPDFTETEVRALTAGFRKREIREIFFELRLSRAASEYRDFFLDAFRREDDDDLIREFWPSAGGS
ncbi:MAG: aspartyl/asparaginyl beta-hydroxylase domain-containing protein [Pseudomonadota bacterium]|nr:aspartyl/asparaginyl beta-hydroxylase domain-containing protein [Pseudomonadota bacterium]